jgi:hypothetical protein
MPRFKVIAAWVGLTTGAIALAIVIWNSAAWKTSADNSHLAQDEMQQRTLPELVKVVDGLTTEHEQEKREREIRVEEKQKAREKLRRLCTEGKLRDPSLCADLEVPVE